MKSELRERPKKRKLRPQIRMVQRHGQSRQSSGVACTRLLTTFGVFDLKCVAKALDFPDRPVTLSNLSIRPCHAGHVCSFLRDRPGDTQPSHLGNQRGSFQSQFRRCAVRSTDDPAGLLKCFQN
jgi:hypothetical protein